MKFRDIYEGIIMKSTSKIICRLLGHKISRLNVLERTAVCPRCGLRLRVSYDGMYGDTLIEGVLPGPQVQVKGEEGKGD